MDNCLSIDIGGTNTAFGILNDSGDLLYSSNLATKEYHSVDRLAEGIHQALKNETKIGFESISIGAPSVNKETQQIEFAPNLEWGDTVDLITPFESVFGIEPTVINDANAATLGEKYFGDAREMKNFAVITLGTGVGLGLFVNGEIVDGNNGLAGEFGHFVIRRSGRECNCGNLGCLETYAGAEGIVLTAKEKLEFSGGGSLLTNVPPSNLTPLEIFNAARKDDPVALEVIDSVCHDLGYALSALINVLDIDNIFITGGVANSGNILKRKVEKYLKSYTLPNLRSKINLKISSLNADGAGIYGAMASYLDSQKQKV